MGRTTKSRLRLNYITVGIEPGNQVNIRLNNQSGIINAREVRRQLRLFVERNRERFNPNGEDTPPEILKDVPAAEEEEDRDEKNK